MSASECKTRAPQDMIMMSLFCSLKENLGDTHNPHNYAGYYPFPFKLRTCAATASAEAALADQVKALRPRGRIQRAVQLSMLSVAS